MKDEEIIEKFRIEKEKYNQEMIKRFGENYKNNPDYQKYLAEESSKKTHGRDIGCMCRNHPKNPESITLPGGTKLPFPGEKI